MRRVRQTLLSILVSTVAAAVVAHSPAGAAAGDVLFSDDFQSYSTTGAWRDGTVHGGWTAVYDGYGTTKVVSVNGNRALQEKPQASTSPGETHASMVVSNATFGNIDLQVRLRTQQQLRSGSTPNPWEVAWVVWGYKNDQTFYYFIPKPNGWELGKVDSSKKDPLSSATCVWPTYANCKYPGGQRFLATGSNVKFPINRWYDVRVTQVAGTIKVWVGTTLITSFVDTENVYTSGQIGLYNEDAQVRFDSVKVLSPALV